MDVFAELEKDKIETGGTPEPQTEPIKETPEVQTETTDGKIAETTTTENGAWWKKYEFEDETKAEEFINTAKTKKPDGYKFASTTAESFNNWVANGGADDFGIFSTVNKFSVSDNPTPDEMVKAMVLKKIMDEPEYAGKEAYIEKKIKKQYMLDADDEYMEDDEKEERDVLAIELKKEFTKVSKGFKELQEKSQPIVDEALATRLKDNPAKLKEYITKELVDFKLDIPNLEKNDKGEIIIGKGIRNSITFDDNMKATLQSYIERLNEERGYPDLSDSSQQEIKAIATVFTIGEHLPFFINRLLDDAVAQSKSDGVKKEIEDTNPSVLGTHEKRDVSTGTGDRSGEMFK